MTNEEVMTLMFDMGLHDSLEKENWIPDNAWVLFANRVAAHEREECAKIAFNARTYIQAAKDIRARGANEIRNP